MPAVGVSSNCVPAIFPRCPTCHKKMVFISVTPTCQSVIYGYMCRNDGDRLSWECLQSHQQKVVRSELRQTSLTLQLPFLRISESMGNYDSKIVDADSVD